jgi:ribonuclease P protein component
MNVPNKPEAIKPDKPSNSTPPKKSLAGVRLRKHADFQRAYAASRKRQSASMSWFLAPQAGIGAPGQPGTRPGPSGPRVGFTAGRVLGKAHERNRIKRRMREVIRRHVDLLPEGADLILHPRRVVLTMEFGKLEAEVVRILTQARVDAANMASRPAVVLPA